MAEASSTMLEVALASTTDLLKESVDISAPYHVGVRLERLAGIFSAASKESRLRPADLIRLNRGLEVLEALVEGTKGLSTSAQLSDLPLRDAHSSDYTHHASGGSASTEDSFELIEGNGQLHDDKPYRESSLWTEDSLQTILDSLTGLSEEMRRREEESTHLRFLCEKFSDEKNAEIEQLKTLMEGTMQAFVDMEQQNQTELRYLRNKVTALEENTIRKPKGQTWKEPSAAEHQLMRRPGSHDGANKNPSLLACSGTTPAARSNAAVGVPPRSASLYGTSAARSLPAPPPYDESEAEARPDSQDTTRTSFEDEYDGGTSSITSSVRRFRRDADTVQKSMEARSRRMDELDSQLRSMSE